ncbi:MAG TPA: APC family permease [Segeticoccus sp.]|uniref:APC family permease n=1 Tax=Segeticoccus sp. TaxID=2706531 RepID=UPI002D7E6BC0|nr:APC family permease [Segeticoccus sp.]HET8601429.1 APC family permease [Segeticoccus sp.]
MSGRVLKRLVVGRAMRSDKLEQTLLPKRVALPVFASDALSSVAYAPDEIFITLSVAGLSAYAFSWKVALAVAVVMLTVVASYRQNVHAYPSGGGDYEVATTNIGSPAGLTVASALMVDYVLTVAVSISSGVQNAASAIDFINGKEVEVAVVLVILLAAMNLRGVRESGTAFAIPTYCFMASIIGMTVWGLTRWGFGDLPQVASAKFDVPSNPGFSHGLATAAGAFLILRTFSSGCAALTGVEAISNGVPAFRKPKSRNAATTLLMMGTIAVTMLIGIIVLANKTGLRYVDPDSDMSRLVLNGVHGHQTAPGVAMFGGFEYDQETVVGQLSHAVFSNFPPAFYFTIAATGVILVLAANTAFNGFPVLASILARDGFLPRQLRTRGDRLAYSNGIMILAAGAIVLIVAFDAQVTRLIQLYIVGVFVSFTTSQIGMILHWNRHLRREEDRRVRGRMMRSRAINGLGAAMSGTVLIVVLVTKFTKGAWIAIAAMAVLFILMRAIKKHYELVREELAVHEGDSDVATLPSRVHALVLVSRIHKPVLRALAYARATRPSILEAITVDVEPEETRALQQEWDAKDIPVPLKALDSPYREITRPVIDYVKSIRRDSPREVVVVYIPEYVVGHWYEQILHNQSALRLKARLLFTPGVMVASVPWQLQSSVGAENRYDGPRAGSVRRGIRRS